MTDPIIHFEEAFAKVFRKHSSNQNIFNRAMLYVFMPFMKLSTIHQTCLALGYKKDKLYRMLDTFREQQWLRLLRVFSYSRAIRVMKSQVNNHTANKNRNRITIGCDDRGFPKSGMKMPLVGLIWSSILRKTTMGTQALYFFIIVGDKKTCFPLDLRLCRGKGRRGRPTKSKQEHVVMMLNDFGKAVRRAGLPMERVVFVADSWFPSRSIIQACKENGISAVFKGKGSYVFVINGNRMKGSELLKSEHQWR